VGIEASCCKCGGGDSSIEGKGLLVEESRKE
jgi:hypothetical protein